MTTPLVSNVSDTARWVAVYRANESARPDALFKDPLAARLAGEKGHAIAASAERSQRTGWSVIARTKLIDDLILMSIDKGCDCVLNLAAGLDTRPYRLPLPPTLHWVEADLPGLVEEKNQLLADVKPGCRFSREAVDLADPVARGAFLDRATAGATKALVLTEGLLMYLDADVVRSLASDISGRRNIHWWIHDVMSPRTLQIVQRGKKQLLASAPMKFAPPNGVAYYEAFGWKALDILPIFRAALRFRRLPWYMYPLGLLPELDPRRPGNAIWSAIVREGRP